MTSQFAGGFEHVCKLEQLEELVVDGSYWDAFDLPPYIARLIKSAPGMKVLDEPETQIVLGYLRDHFAEAEAPLL